MSGTNSDMDVGVSRDAVSATTLPTWGTMTAEERANPQYLGEIEKLYKKRIDSTKADDERSDLLNSLAQITEGRQAALRTAETRVKDIEKELDRVDKADKSEARLLRYKGFVRKHEIYYVATEHVFMQYFPDRGDWCQLRPEALYMQYSISYGDDMEAFQKALADLGRKKMTVECSFYPKPDRVLNLMRRDHWLKPTSGEPHYAFNLLTRSLGNGKDGGSLYELYKEFSQVVNPAARGVLGRNKFLGKAEEWVRRKALPIERGQVKIVLGEDIKKQSSTTGFYRLPGHRVFRGNKDKYKKALGRTPFWERARVEPRLALVDPAQALEGVENVGDLDKLQRLQAREKEKAEARRQKSRKKISDEPAKKRQVPPNALKILEKM